MMRKTLEVEIACSQDEAKLFMDLIIYLWDRRHRQDPLPTPELDAVFNQRAEQTITQYSQHIDDFGIDCTYDKDTSLLRLHDIDGAPNLSALAMVLIHLYPHLLPITYALTDSTGLTPTIWTVLTGESIIITDDPAQTSITAPRRDPCPHEPPSRTFH